MTRAELVAFNYGVDVARARELAPTSAAADRVVAELPFGTDRLEALEALGAQLFASWADRGYDQAQPTTH